MAWYSKGPALRRRQVAMDASLLAWTAMWIVVGVVVDGLVSSLAKPLRASIKSLEGVRDHVHDAATSAGSLPVGGGQLRPPVDAIGDQVGAMIAALNDQARQIEFAGTVLGFGIPMVALAAWLCWWLPRRLRSTHRTALGASRAARNKTGRTDETARIPLAADRAALHAIMTAPTAKLVAIDADPIGAWRRGDAGVVQELADLDAALATRRTERDSRD